MNFFLSHILSGIVFLPLLAVLLIWLSPGTREQKICTAKWIALIFSLIDFALTVVLWCSFKTGTADFQFVELAPWLGGGISYHLGVDGISMLFVVLTAALTPFCILASWKSVKERVREYMIAFMALECLMLGVFVALDLFLFYIFFEASLIPMFLIIGIWGGPRRVYASFKFFLYTLLGSLFMLLAVLAIYYTTGTSNIPVLIETVQFPPLMEKLLWLGFFASFAVKMPMWPVHTWLPDAHVEAPTAGSVLLAAVLLKMGGYGFLRFSLPMFASASVYFVPLIFALSLIAIVYTSFVALAQEDMKKLIAYSSVAHMGIVTLGIFTFTRQGIDGGIYQMLSHGVVSGALFLCVGVVYDRLHTRQIADYGGVVNTMPKYAMFFMLFALANMGLPGTGNFVGEILSLVGAFHVSSTVAIIAALGTILSCAYMLYLYRRILFGEAVKETVKALKDLTAREYALLIPLAIVTLIMGFWPQPIFNVTGASVDHLIARHMAAVSYDESHTITAPQLEIKGGAR